MRGIEQELCSLEPGNHVCLAHVTQDEKHKTIATFLRDGLRRGERCLYLAEGAAHDAVCSLIHRAGLAVDGLREREALTLRVLEDVHGPDGKFEPDRPAALARALMEGARRDGFNGFRIVSDSSNLVAADDLANEKLARYEAGITDLLHGTRGAALCVYDRRNTPTEILDVVLRTHPVAFLSGRLCANPFCEPAQYNLGNVGQSRKIDWMINQILNAEEGQRLLRSMNDALIREAAALTSRNESARQRIESMQEAIAARDRLLLMVAGWLADPLPALLGHLETSLNEIQLDSIRDRLDSCAESLRVLQSLARGLDQATTLIQKPPVLRNEDADLVELTTAAVNAVGGECDGEPPAFRILGMERLPGVWDRTRLLEALRLLLTTAGRMVEDEPVEVSVDDLGMMARVRIEYHATERGPHDQSSSGACDDDETLALWAPRELLRLMGGRFGLVTKEDGRTVVTVDLPRRPAAPATHEHLLH
jgi:hypothetical protein